MEKKIKICVIATVYQSMDWFIVDSMRHLAQNGYDVTLVCNMTEEFIAQNSDFATCVHLPMKRGASIKEIFVNVKALRRLFKKEKYDVIYYTSPNAAMYAAIAGKQAKIKTRINSQCGMRYVAFKGIKRFIFKMVEKLTCKYSTHVRAQSPLNMQLAIDEGICSKEKISVVGIGGTTGVDIKACDSFDRLATRNKIRDAYLIPHNALVYGFVGRLNKDKGINELLEAFYGVGSKLENAYLMLVGGWDDVNPMSKENAEKLKKHSNIITTGNIPRDKVYEYMSAFDVLVHPTYREGFGKVLQEAMGMRLPIITTDIPGPKEVVGFGEYGILVPPQTVDELATAMEHIADDYELREKLAEKGRARAEKYFDRPIMINNVLQDINAIVKGE